jgi:hypothetical protein
MTITIEKRTRTTSEDIWSSWGVTTDVAPFVNTELVEYRVANTTLLSDTFFNI